MNSIFGILRNYILLSAVTGWCVAQFAKVLIGVLREEKVNIIRLFLSTGGMPSSHSAITSALCIASGIEYGVGSFQFSIAFVLAVIVMQDAAGVRKEVGKQAKVINQMQKKFFNWPIDDATLKELVGHTPLQVLIGAVVGVTTALVMRLIISA